jgi:ketosteroid isomerase-like protein
VEARVRARRSALAEIVQPERRPRRRKTLADRADQEEPRRDERFLDAGERVVVFVHVQPRGVASGAPLDLRTAHVWTVHEGRAVSWEPFPDRAEAVEEVGLRE